MRHPARRVRECIRPPIRPEIIPRPGDSLATARTYCRRVSPVSWRSAWRPWTDGARASAITALRDSPRKSIAPRPRPGSADGRRCLHRSSPVRFFVRSCQLRRFGHLPASFLRNIHHDHSIPFVDTENETLFHVPVAIPGRENPMSRDGARRASAATGRPSAGWSNVTSGRSTCHGLSPAGQPRRGAGSLPGGLHPGDAEDRPTGRPALLRRLDSRDRRPDGDQLRRAPRPARTGRPEMHRKRLRRNVARRWWRSWPRSGKTRSAAGCAGCRAMDRDTLVAFYFEGRSLVEMSRPVRHRRSARSSGGCTSPASGWPRNSNR